MTTEANKHGERIDALTDEHRAGFGPFIDEWTAVGRSVEPMNTADATEGVRAAYTAAGYDPPEHIYFEASPPAGIQKRNRILAEHGAPPVPWHKDLFGGNHYAGWLAFYDWFGRNGMGSTVEPLTGLILLARSASWCWFHRGFAVVTDRPCSLSDEVISGRRRRLHNPDGPSVEYRDGWRLWHWHGLLVPQWVIENPTVEKIAGEPNTEIRRAGIESLGWPNYVDHLTLVDDAGDDLIGRLYDPPADLYADLDEPVRVIVVRNGTPAVDGTPLFYGQTVPASCTTARDAQNWMAGVPAGLVLERRT